MTPRGPPKTTAGRWAARGKNKEPKKEHNWNKKEKEERPWHLKINHRKETKKEAMAEPSKVVSIVENICNHVPEHVIIVSNGHGQGKE